MLASVELGLADQIPDAVTFGPLVQFGNDRVTLILNALFGKTFGEFRQTGLGFEYAAQFKVALIDQFSAGVEAFGELENLSNVPSFDQTNFRIGPMIYFSSGGGGDESKAGEGGGDEKGLAVAGRDIGVTADIGLLLGATEATPDVTVKWDLGISF